MSTESPDTWEKLSQVNRLNLIGQVVRVLSVLLTHICVVRALNHSDLSDYTWLYALCIFPQTLFTLGFEQSFSYFIPRFLVNSEKEKVSQLFWFSVKCLFIFSFLSLLLFSAAGAGLLSFIGESRLFGLFVITLLANSMFALAQIPIGALRGLEQFRFSILSEQFLFPGLPFLFVVIACLLFPSPLSIILSQGLGYLLTALFAYWRLFLFFRSEGHILNGKPANTLESKKWLIYSIPIALMLTSEVVFNWVILSVTKTILSDLEVSFLGVAVRSIQMFTFLSMGLAPLLMPKISHHSETGNQEELHDIIHKMSYWLSCWAMIIGFGLAINRHFVLSIFSPDFAAISGLLLWLIPGGIVEGMGAYIKLASLSVGQNIYGFWLYFSGSIVTAFACYFGALYYGAEGALAAGSLGFAYINLIRVTVFLRKAKTHLYTGQQALKIIGALITLILSFYLLESNLEVDAWMPRLLVSVFIGLCLLASTFWQDRQVFLG